MDWVLALKVSIITLVVMSPWFIALFWRDLITTIFFKREKNPYRRTCKKCGQIQNEMTLSYNRNIIWWEDVMPVPDEKCICHKFAKYVP